MRIFFLAILTLFSSLAAFAGDRGDVCWLASDYYFGVIKEADGPKRGSVKLVNKGRKATFIRAVRPSCGCTSVDFTKEKIQPGDTATISFTYDPAGRPGAFDKAIRVYMGDGNGLKTIRIAGTVIGSPETLDVNYPHRIGNLRLETVTVLMGELKRGSRRHAFVNVCNQDTDSISLILGNPGEGLKVSAAPEKIGPGEIGTVTICLDTSLEKRDGPVEYQLEVGYGRKGEEPERGVIDIIGAIVPDSRSMSMEEIEQSPRAYLVPEFIDFGEVAGEGPLRFEFEVADEGGSTLEIRRIYSYDKKIKIDPYRDKVSSGEKVTVSGKLETGHLAAGPFRKEVNVITNDPLHPVRTASLVGIKK